MGNELELKEMLDFIYSYNVNSNRNNIFLNQTVIAENYLKRLKTLDKNLYTEIGIMTRKQENVYVKVKFDEVLKTFTEKDVDEKTFKHFD